MVHCRLKGKVDLYDSLHGFRKGRGTGTETLEENLEQKLAGLAHDPLFKVFLDMRNMYNLIDQGMCMELLRGYGLRPNLARLLAHYWGRQHILPEAGRFLGRVFGMGRGVMQGDP